MSSTHEAPLERQIDCRVGGQGSRFATKFSKDLYSRKSIVRSTSFANDLLVYLEIFTAFIRIYVAVIAVILSLGIRGDTSPMSDTSPLKTKPSIRTRFISGLDV